MIEQYLSALIIIFLPTRLANKVFGRTMSPIKAALASFISISLLVLAISPLTMGIWMGFITYIPCLIFIFLVDIYKAKTKVPADNENEDIQ
ncbi:hypothetical protein [Psychromonas ossibalaenae]|uniref:hypothetical protein n=1 Tax=Psychromonas ossibalaenae TaxID=444922 RepID=UPI00035C75E7|nr:hypothetical protein [Psychromonas ossibalaenae]